MATNKPTVPSTINQIGICELYGHSFMYMLPITIIEILSPLNSVKNTKLVKASSEIFNIELKNMKNSIILIQNITYYHNAFFLLAKKLPIDLQLRPQSFYYYISINCLFRYLKYHKRHLYKKTLLNCVKIKIKKREV